MTLPLILITVSLLATVLHFVYRFHRTPQLARAMASIAEGVDECKAEGLYKCAHAYRNRLYDAGQVHAGCVRFTALTLRFGLVLSAITSVLLLIELAEALEHLH